MWAQAQFGEQIPLSAVPSLNGVYLAQVVGLSAQDHTVKILLPDLNALLSSDAETGCKAHVLEHRASQLVGEVSLPRVGDWGVVVFPGGTSDLAVWLGSIYENLSNITTEAADTHLTQYEDGSWFRVKVDGTVEYAHPSGTYLRLGSGTALGTRTRRERQGSKSRVVPHPIPTDPSITLHVEHSSGAKLTIAPDGEITLSCASGKLLHLAGTTGEDFVALKAGLEKVQLDLTTHVTWATSHAHAGVTSGPSNSSVPTAAPAVPAPLMPDLHYTQQAKAT